MPAQNLDGELDTGGRLGLDIETISPTLADDAYPDFDDPGDFELLATAVVYEPPAGEPVEDVRWRDGIDAESEAAHAIAVADLIEAVDPAQVVTYNGDRFDMPILRGRARVASERLGEQTAATRMAGALDGRDHLDLKHAAWDRYGRYSSLEDVLEANDLPVRRTLLTDYDHGHDLAYRSPADPAYIQSSDIPAIGEAYLRTIAGEADNVDVAVTREMLAEYALGDIEHLLTLADRHPF